MKNFLFIVMTGIALTACVPQPQVAGVPSSVVGQYQTYNCNQLGLERNRLARKITEHQKTDTASQILGAVSVLAAAQGRGSVAPAGRDAETQAELDALKDRYDLLEEVAIQKDCAL